MMDLYDLFETIFQSTRLSHPVDEEERIGYTHEGWPITAYRFGRGPLRISLLAGCQGDEPVGPMLLEKLVAYLHSLAADHQMLSDFNWSIVPNINRDSQLANAAWTRDAESAFDPIKYLRFRKRDEPAEDMEFGFPLSPDDNEAHPENSAVYLWWKKQEQPFHLHVSLHNMGFGAGPWFLLSPQWSQRCPLLIQLCQQAAKDLRYHLHDVERLGENGYNRIGRGFCTHPISMAIQHFYIIRDDFARAKKIRLSSMECVRSFGGDPLTLMSEIPLFITPGVGEILGPPDPRAEMWRRKLHEWSERTKTWDHHTIVREMKAMGLRAMPIRHQMQMHWRLVTAGIEQLLSLL
ncbi:MAG TPA: hypothetical protein PL021_03040 [bacterium]|nr:hypothetical protein [bacterium]